MMMIKWGDEVRSTIEREGGQCERASGDTERASRVKGREQVCCRVAATTIDLTSMYPLNHQLARLPRPLTPHTTHRSHPEEYSASLRAHALR